EFCVEHVWREVGSVRPADGPEVGIHADFGEARGIAQLFEHAIEAHELCNVHLSMDAIVEFHIKTVPTERPDLDDVFDHGVTLRLESAEAVHVAARDSSSRSVRCDIRCPLGHEAVYTWR